MSTLRKDFVYDDFERHLLDTAQFDQAPQDLPARLGLAMGLSIPILVATEVTTSLAALSSTAEVGSALAPTGIAASFKAAFGVGSTSLFGTAMKGLAIGVLSGSALLGTGHAVASFVSEKPTPLATVAAARLSSPSVPTRSARASVVSGGSQAPSRTPEPLPVAALSESRAAMKSEPTPSVHAPMSPTREQVTSKSNAKPNIEPNTDANTNSNAEPSVPPAVPEKTLAVGRFPAPGDDVSALYDSPKPAANLPDSVKEKTAEPDISAAELRALRNAALQKTRTLLGQSKSALALAELEQFRRRAGSKHFGVTELLLRIEALADLGRAKEAQADVAIVERLAPASSALRQAQLLARSRFVR